MSSTPTPALSAARRSPCPPCANRKVRDGAEPLVMVTAYDAPRRPRWPTRPGST